MCTILSSCWMGQRVISCEVEGKINEEIKIYPIKPNGKRKKNFTSISTGVFEYTDSFNFISVWHDDNKLKPVHNAILYGQPNKNNEKPIIPAENLKIGTRYDIVLRLTYVTTCGCAFIIDENGNVVNLK